MTPIGLITKKYQILSPIKHSFTYSYEKYFINYVKLQIFVTLCLLFLQFDKILPDCYMFF